ncbi:MAG: prepilin peptidase [Phycisphaerae bacterium]|nr:prepilin peptidase [Phycisphaerae bacterium]
MPRHEALFLALKSIWALFIFAYGACLGSLINVLVYRLPRGISVVSPPSRCPACQTRLTWRENIPVLGWLLLRGKCRFCKAPISPEYPIVEAIVGLLFVACYLACYGIDPRFSIEGIHLGAIRPEWAQNDAMLTWPIFVVLLFLVASLVAMTIIDARTFTIPLVLTWVPAGIALVGHTGAAAWLEQRYPRLPLTAPGELWSMPVPGPMAWNAVGAALGGTLGLGVGLLLLRLGLITRSFADYAEWEKSVTIAQNGEGERLPDASAAASPGPADHSGDGTPVSPANDTPDAAPAGPAPHDPPPTDLWVQYPHARREMVKELAFLAPCVLLALAGWYLAPSLAGVTQTSTGAIVASARVPLWLSVMSGVLIGYLVGGGVVWGVRIFGSMAFGKEAMGLGDAHLMAAVGACLGWIDATLAFFAAAFVALAWAVLGRLGSGVFKKAMPYGPFLAVATLLVFFAKPLAELGLSRLLHRPINLP